MKSKAFTLIELLVVIAIVGLLSTIAVVSLTTTRDKARIASGASFEQSLYNSLGSALVAAYDFEEGSGSVIVDSSGNGNNASISGSPTWSTDTFGSGSKYSMNFTGSDHVNPASSLGISNTNFTIAFWIKTTSINGQMYVIANAGSGVGYRFGLSTGVIGFLIGGTDAWTETTCGTKTANDGKWHHVAGVFDVTGHLFSGYIDGHLVGTVSLPYSYADRNDIAPWIGRGMCCTSFVGQLDNVRIFSQNLSGVSINSLYNEEKKQFAFLNIKRK